MRKSFVILALATLTVTSGARAETLCSDASMRRIPEGVRMVMKNQVIVPFGQDSVNIGTDGCQLTVNSLDSRDNRRILPRELEVKSIESDGRWLFFDIKCDKTISKIKCPVAYLDIQQGKTLMSNAGLDVKYNAIPAAQCHRTIDAQRPVLSGDNDKAVCENAGVKSVEIPGVDSHPVPKCEACKAIGI